MSSFAWQAAIKSRNIIVLSRSIHQGALNALPMMPFVTAAVSIRLKGCRQILTGGYAFD
jgi:hypothetical protein